MIRGLAQNSFKKYKMKDCESRSDERKGEFRNIHAGFMCHFASPTSAHQFCVTVCNIFNNRNGFFVQKEKGN